MSTENKTYKIVGIEKALAPSVYEKEIWNAAIEAAANVDALGMNEYLAETIRKLKK